MINSNVTAFVRARIEPTVKEKAEIVLDELGITPTQAVRMLYSYIARHHEWPIELKIPNKLTAKVFAETDEGIDLNICKDSKQLFEELGI